MTFQELLQHPTAYTLIPALDRHIKIDEFDEFHQAMFSRKLHELAERIYETDNRGRSLEDIKVQCATGLLGEIAVAQLLYKYAPPCLTHIELNDEAFTHEYCWDIRARFEVREFRFEVKYQAKNTEGFSFRHKEQCETAHQNWRNWNIMVGFYITDDLSTVVPTSLVMNYAFEELYKNSRQDGGTYLQTGKAATRGWFYQLNVGRRP